MTSYATYMLCVFIDARGLLRMAAPAIIKAGVWGVVCDVPDVTRLLSRGSIPPAFISLQTPRMSVSRSLPKVCAGAFGVNGESLCCEFGCAVIGGKFGVMCTTLMTYPMLISHVTHLNNSPIVFPAL